MSRNLQNGVMVGTGLEEITWDYISQLPAIPELNFAPDTNYAVSTLEEVLYPIIADNQIVVVAGAFFGDEGKGKTVDAIARHPDVTMVARVNSGANAGHTVVNDGKEYIFHMMPSGILIPGVTNYIGSESVMDPVGFFDGEVQPLIDGKIDFWDRIFVGNVHLVTPYHRLMDVLRNVENVQSEADLENLINANVSTLQGMAPVHASKVMKQGPRLNDVYGKEKRLRRILEKDMSSYRGMLLDRKIDEELLLKVCQRINADRNRIPDYIMGFLGAGDKAGYVMGQYRTTIRNNDMFPQRADVKYELERRLENGEKLMLEGPQSYWLSNSVETDWSSSTSANTTAAGIIAASGINFLKHKAAVINVHKFPGSSRVGKGANPAGLVPQTFYSDQAINTLDDLGNACTDYGAIQSQFWKSVGKNGALQPTIYQDNTGSYMIGAAMAIAESREYHEKGATSGKPRVMSLFDCVKHAEVMRTQGPYTTISAVDRGDNQDNVGVVIAYAYYNPQGDQTEANGKTYSNGDIIKAGDPVPNEVVSQFCHPIIKLIPTWKNTPIAADKWKPEQGLPYGVKYLIGTIEHFTGAQIISIGNGKEPQNLIYIKRVENLI